MASTMHWEPNFSAPSFSNDGIFHRPGIQGNLVGAGFQEGPDVVGGSHTPAHGQGHEDRLGRAGHHIQQDVAFIGGGRDIEEDQLVGLLGVVLFGDLHRVARVVQVQELDALDDPAFLDVQAGDDSFG